MATNLTHFLITIGDDPQQFQNFEQNPQATMTAAGLTQAEQTLILNRDVQGIRNHLLADPGLRQAIGIPPGSPLPTKLPTCVFMVPKP
jgi:hypothetical protein